MKTKTEFKLQEGEQLTRRPNNPIISVKPKHGYIWIGNDAEGDRFCFATLSGKKTLLKLAAAIRRAAQ